MSVTRELLQQLEAERKSKIISLIYSDGAFMNDSDVDIVYEVLDDVCEGKRVDTIEMILSSLGGEASAAFNLVKTIRRYADKFNVIIPRKAKSGASLLALGANKIFMSKIAELGPIDPLVSHPYAQIMIPARAAPYFIEKVLPEISKMGISEYFLKVDYAHVSFCLTAVEQARDYAKRLLTSYHFREQPDKLKIVDDAVRRLTSYPSHDFVIDIDEARDVIGLNVEELSEEHWKLVWSVYREYIKRLDDVGLIIETTKKSLEIERPKPRPTLW
jgi:sulfur relay (sulfurtransferase) DsrC/TusE family protein